MRRIAAVLAVLILWLSPGLPWTARCWADEPASGPRVPLVLIGEPGKRDEGWLPESLSAKCVAEGYQAERDLFVFSPGPFQDFSDGAATLTGYVNQSVPASKTGQVDVVACGVSGLIVRLALEAGMIRDGTVRNLVMVGSPNRGTFLADLLKSVVDIAKHESLFEKETRAWRYLPIGEEVLARDVIPEDGEGKPVAAVNYPGPKEMTWEDEVAWISGRVNRVYEPLFAKYVEERYLVVPYVPAESPKETFAGWLQRTMPGFWESAVKGGTAPPDGDGGFAGAGASLTRGTPPAGQDLSMAYYEVLSMEVAKNQYAMRLASKGSVLESLLKQPYVPAGWKDALLYYGIRVLQYYARKALVTVKTEVQQAIVNQIADRSGFVEGSDSPLLRRLIKDDLVVNLGTSMSRRFERLPANTYLRSLNGNSSQAGASRTTRYACVAARLANPWSLLWPQLGPNDYFLEVDSSIAPTGPRDCARVFPGFVAPSGEGLLADQDVQGYLFSLLNDGDTAVDTARPLAGPGATGKLTVSSWRPSYVEVSGPRDSVSGNLALSVTLPDPPSGWQYEAWSEEPGAVKATPCSSLRDLATGGTYAIRCPTGRIGLRLARTAPVNPVLGGTVGSAFAVETKVEALVSVLEAGPIAGEPGPGPQGPEGQDTEEDVPPKSAGDGTEGYPLVRVVNRSKQTTHKQAKETYHEFWVLDFGDGTAQRVDGCPLLEASHVFQAGGPYTVRAQSYDNRGDPLVSKEWQVKVAGADDASRKFSCRSIARPVARLTLTGPSMWVTGKPAAFSANLQVELPPGAEVVSIEYDPGSKFCVLWERAGDFQVSCAATARLRYLLEDDTLEVENTYVYASEVTVLTTGVTR